MPRSLRLLLAVVSIAFAASLHAHGVARNATEPSARPAPVPMPVTPPGPVSGDDTSARARALTISLVELKAQINNANANAQGPLVAQLVAAAHDRRDLLEALVDKDPAEVLRIALPADLRSGVPGQAIPFLEEDADESGEIEVIHVDHVNPADDYYVHSLKTSHGTFVLHFAGAMPDVQSGTNVQVHGVRIGQSIVLAAGDLAVQKSVAVLSNTLGAQKTLVILVNFSDAPTQPFTTTTAYNTVFGTTSNYDYEASYQQTTLTGTVVGWYTIANPSTNCDYSTIASQAKQAASAAGVQLSNYNRYVYAFPSNTCSWWGLGTVGGNPSQAWVQAKYGFTLTVVGHEMGHNLGLYHSHSLDCGTAVVASSGCTTSEYGDIFDMMGSPGTTPHYSAYQKERLGWLNAGVSPPLTTVSSGSANYVVGAMEDARSTTPRALKIPRSSACTAPTEWFYVESRQAKGFDAFLSSNANVLGGVLIHKVTDGDPNGSFLLDMTPATSSWSDPALDVGQTFTDPATGLAITAVSSSATGATVNVTFPASSCARAAPQVTATPTGTVWTSAGSTTTYAVTVTNKDSCGCTATTFDVGGTVPTGWSATSARTASIAPGASAASSMAVTVPSAAAATFYTVSVNGTNSSASALTTSVAETVAVASTINVAVATNAASYTLPRQRNRSVSATITTTVTSGGQPVAGAAVAVTITSPGGKTTTLSATTASNGVASVAYSMKQQTSPTGTYGVSSRATIGNMTGSATTSFVVN